MTFSCETIINENEKLKLTDLDKSCLNIFDYLNLHHHINFLQIDIKKNDTIQNLFIKQLISSITSLHSQH